MKLNDMFIINTAAEPNNVIFNHAECLKEAGYNPIFVFPKRSHNEDYSFYKNYDYINLNFIFSTKNKISYFLSTLKLIYFVTKTFFNKKNAKNFFAIDMPGNLACLLMKAKKAKIITLVNDNFSARYNLPSLIYAALRFIESLSYKLISNLVIFPDASRHLLLGNSKYQEVAYIPNILPDQNAPKYIGNNEKNLKVLLCGWLDATRGVELIENTLNSTSEEVKFVLVGSGEKEIIEKLSKSDRVTYIKHVSRDENLKIMSMVDLNMAFYNPGIPINRNALPQKVYDSLLVGCPVYINSEVNMSNDLHKKGLCLKSEYFDIKTLANNLNDLVANKNMLDIISAEMQSYYSKNIDYSKTRADTVNLYRTFNNKINV